MAQLVERYVRNVQATSSNLVISTKQYPIELICRRQAFGRVFSFLNAAAPIKSIRKDVFRSPLTKRAVLEDALRRFP